MPKAEAFVETVIAFANTLGAKIFVGVQDDGSPHRGDVELCGIFHGDTEAASKHQQDRLKVLVREKIKPVPQVAVKQITVSGHPVIAVVVERGSQRPYATHENKVFVRKGATNRLADPHSELPGLLATDY
jgi:predicted HTH transcriptional regulator